MIYLLKDIVINNDTSLTYSYNNSSWTSKYSVTEKDGKKIYIASDGLILGIDDRFGNKIRFAHTTHTVSDFNPLNGVIENNISYPLISRITDSLNRVVVFDYSSPDKVILTVSNDLDANDKKVITYNKKLANNTDAVSGIPTGQRGRLDSEYILDNVTENVNYTENRTVSYKYNIKYTKESLLTKNINHLNDPENQSFGGTYNYYACLSNIIYPTGGKTVYEYNPGIKYSGTDTSVNGFDGRDSSVDPVPDTVIKNCGTSGSMYYYRVTKRYELDGTEVINNKVYTYNKSGNNMYDGYPKYADSNNLPDTFKYTTDIVDSNGNKQTYTYNNKWLCEDLLDEASDHKFRTKYYYDKSKKLLLKKTIRKADKATGNFTVSNEDYEYDDYGNLTGYWDNQALRKYDSSKDEYIRYDPSKTEERSQYTFYPLGTWDSTYTTYTDTVKGKAISVNPDEFKTTFTYHPEYHYLTGKIYKKDENTTIREEYTPTSTETDNPVQVRNGKAIRFLKVFEKKDSGSEVLKKKTEYQYDQYGNVIKQIAYYTSTGNGDLNSSTLNVTTVFDYTDNKGRPAFNGAYLTKKSNSRILDTDGNLVEGRTSNLSGTIDELYYYDWFGNLVKVQDGNGFTKSYVYDKLWRLTKEVNDNDGGSYKQWDYKLDSTENSVTFTDENNTKISDVTKRHKTKTVYDVFGNKTYEKVYIEDENEQFSWVDKRKYTYYNDMKLDTVYDLVNNSNTKHEYYIDGRLKSKQTQEGDGTILFKESYVYLDATSDNLYSKVTKTILGGNNGASPQIVTSTYTDTSNMLRRQERPHTNSGISKIYKDTYDYNYIGNKISEKIARAYDESWTENKTSSYDYDFEGRLVKQTNIKGDPITILYDEIGRKLAFTDIKGGKAQTKYSTTYRYDNLGRLIEEKVPFEGNSDTGEISSYMLKKYYYDRNGNVKGEKVYSNSTDYTLTKYGYDSLNRLNIVKKFEQKQNQVNFNAADSSYIGNINFTQYYYDSVGNKLRMYTGLSGYLTINGLDNFTPSSDTDFSVMKYEYDGLGRLIKVTDSAMLEETYEYDLNNNMVSKYDKNKNKISISYDGLNRVIKKSSASEEYYSTPEPTGHPCYVKPYWIKFKFVKANGDWYENVYYYNSIPIVDVYVSASKETGGGGVSYISNNIDVGGITAYTTWRRQIGTTYNGWTELIEERFLSQSWGNFGTCVSAEVSSNFQIYDALNSNAPLPIEETPRLDVYYYTYALNGNRLSMEGGGTKNTYRYDDLGRLIYDAEDDVKIIKTYDYNASDKVTSFKIYKKSPSNILKLDISYTYDKLDRLQNVYEYSASAAWLALSVDYGYDDNGNRSSIVYKKGNTTINTTDYAYNLANRLKTLTNKNGSTKLSDYSYTYYIDGNINTKSDSVSGKLTEYVYDGMNRLHIETEKQADNVLQTITYNYNDSCNRDTMIITGTNQSTTSYEYSSDNRLKKEYRTGTTDNINTTSEYFYDNNGNQICKTVQTEKPATTGQTESFGVYVAGESDNKETIFYDYDGFNQLISTASGQNKTTYRYNADGLRISKKVNGIMTYFVWDGQNVAAELNNLFAVSTTYIRGINLIARLEGFAKTLYLFNGHGDVVQLTNGTDGSKIKDYEYDAFGNEKNIDANDINCYRYCGEYFDKETGTIYLRARYYDPAIGRFITEDSYRGEDNDPLTLNLYTYCHNNPVYYADPSGHIVWAPILVAIAAYAGYTAVETVPDVAIDYVCDGDDFSPVKSVALNYGMNLIPGLGEGNKAKKVYKLGKFTTNKVFKKASTGVGDVKLLPEPQISPRRAAALEKQRIAAQGTGGSGGVDFIGTESGTSIHAIQSELKTSLTNAGATRIGPSTLTTETGEIFHMNTGNGPMEIRIMDGRVGGGPLQGPRTIITRPGTKEYIYPNGARIEGAVPLSTRKQIGHIHGQR